MKRILHLFLIIAAVFLSNIQSGNAQGTVDDIFGAGGDLIPDRQCAPVKADFQVRFFSYKQIPLNNLKVKIDWEHGIPQELLAADITESPGANSTYTYSINVDHSYPAGNDKCEYFPTATLFVNGMESNEKVTRNLVVWDKDNANGGKIVITPTLYQACPGQEFTVTFKDASNWNCTPPKVTDKMNKFSRWTKFIYGTSEVQVSDINGVKVNGTVQTYPYKGAVKAHEYTGLNEILFPDHLSFPVTVPATAQVGERFEIKLLNWNRCNPYDPNLSEADNEANAVVTYAHIEIVPKPEASVTAPANVCPGKDVKFRGGSTVNDVDFLWKIYNDEQGTELLKQATSKDYTLTGGFATAGKKKVTLLVKRKSPYDGSCFDLEEYEIEVSNAPTVDSYLNDAPGNELKLCHDPVTFPAGQTVKFSFDLMSANTYEYELYLLARNSASDSLDATGNRVGTGLVSVLNTNTPNTPEHTSTFTKPGVYRARVKVKDIATGCETEQESVVIINDTPVAAFSNDVICHGEATSFTNQSSLLHKINGDDIETYLWEFGDGTGATSTDKNPGYTFSATGPYDVKLTVTTKGGCMATVTNQVTVFAQPKAGLTSNYSTAICPGDEIVFTNSSFAANESTFGAGKVVYTLEYTDGTSSVVEPFVPGVDFRSLKFKNNTSNILTYTVKMRAKSNEGCEKVSDPISIEVNPGAKAYFDDPDYNIFSDDICTDIDFNFTVDQATLDLGGSKHVWTVYKNGVEAYNYEALPSDPFYKVLPYTGVNDTETGMVLKVTLEVPVTTGKCVQPAEQKYLIQPRPAAEILNPIIRQECDITYIDIKLNKTTGIKEYKWTISPVPDNITNVTYDDEFTLIYSRPVSAVNGGGDYLVSLELIKENVFGCEQKTPSTKTINITPKDIEEVELDLISSTTEGCSPLKIEFKNETAVAPGDFIYELYINNGSLDKKVELSDVAFEDGLSETDGLEGSFFYTFTTPGTYTARLKAIGNGCEIFSPATVAFVVHDFPKADFDLDKKEGCAVLTSSIINNIQGSVTNEWVVTDITEVSPGVSANLELFRTTDPITSIDFPNTGLTVKEYEVKLIATSANNCSAESTKTVKVFPAANAVFNATELEICAPFELEVTNTSVNPVGTTYTWNWGDGTSTITSDTDPVVVSHAFTNPSFSVAQLRYITLTATTPDGCKTTSAPVEVKLRPQVKAAFTPSVTMGCSPLQLYLQDNSMGASTHKWEIKEKGITGPAFYTSNVSLPSDVPELVNNESISKVYEVSLTVANADGCVNTEMVEITVLPGAKADFSMDYTSALCNGESTVTFTNLNISPGTEYTWSWGDGEPNEVTTTESSVSHTFVNNSTTRSKQFEITLTAKNLSSNCSSQMKKTIIVNPMVEVMVVPDKKQGCAPLEVNFTNQSRNVASHQWFVRLLGTNQQEQMQSGEDAGFILENITGAVLQYEIVYTGISATGCKDTEVHLVEVFPMPEPDFVTDSLRLRLPNSTFKIENRTSHKDAWTHHWDFGDGTTSDEVDPVSHSYGTYGKFTISLTVSNGVCSETYEQEVIINEILPIVDFESIPVSGCWPLVVNFKNNSQFADENKYRWDFGDGEGYATSVNPNYTYHKPGEYTVTLTATNAGGEVAIARHSIVTVFERPRIDFELRDNVVFVPGDPLYVANHTKGASTYLWDFGDGTTYTDFEPVHYYQEPGVYTISLIATNEWGCADTLVMDEVVTAKAGGKAKIPNAFTPDVSGSSGGDIAAGNNDVFFPVLDGGVSRYNMKIYNRWGELLFESNKREIGWDGYYKGQLCKADVYVFKLSVEFSDGKKMEQLGDLTLIR